MVVFSPCHTRKLELDLKDDVIEAYFLKYLSVSIVLPIPIAITNERFTYVVISVTIGVQISIIFRNRPASDVDIHPQRWATERAGLQRVERERLEAGQRALVVLDRKKAEDPKATGEDILVGEEASGLSTRILHCNWSSPAYGEVDGQGVLIFGGPDGVCYAFDPNPVKDEDGYGILKDLWSYDCNPKEYRFRDGDESKPIKYATYGGPSEIIATPVFADGKVYVSIGQDPEHGEGVGNFVCIDAKTGNKVWNNRIDRTISTCSVADGLVYVADYSGFLRCFDAADGTLYWEYDTVAPIWGSTLVADGKVYLGNEDGLLTIFHTEPTRKLADELGAPVVMEYRRGALTAKGKKGEKELKGADLERYFHEIDFGAAIYLTPVVADNRLYVGTMTHLYAVGHEADASPGAGNSGSGSGGSSGGSSGGGR